MPKFLLIKTSSMGDIIHALPVVSDIRHAVPGATIDWVVEQPFADLPRLHPGIRSVIPLALRRWRSDLHSASTWREIGAFRRDLRREAYDTVLDLQGLLKSAIVTRIARGPRHGYDRRTAREPLAALFYQRHFGVAWDRHAVERNRQLAARAIGYSIADTAPDYGIRAPSPPPAWAPVTPYAVLLSATSRASKLWPETHWISLGKRLAGSGVTAVLPSGSDAEHRRAQRIADAVAGAVVAQPLTLAGAASLMAGARAVVGVDTGLVHLAAALNVPVVALYCATSPDDTGVYAGEHAINLGGIRQTPTAEAVWQAVGGFLAA